MATASMMPAASRTLQTAVEKEQSAKTWTETNSALQQNQIQKKMAQHQTHMAKKIANAVLVFAATLRTVPDAPDVLTDNAVSIALRKRSPLAHQRQPGAFSKHWTQHQM